MKKLIPAVLVVMAALSIAPGTVLFAQFYYDFDDALDDLDQIATAITSVLGPSLGDMAYLGDTMGYSITPHFEIGVGMGIVGVPLGTIDTGDIEMDYGALEDVGYFPIPSLAAHARFTFKERFEVGVKVGGVPSFDYEEVGASVENLILGGKFRYELLKFGEKAVRGGVSVGGQYEYVRGGITLSASENIPIDVDEDGVDDGEFSTTAALDTRWHSSTFSGEIQGNVHLLFLNLFAGSRIGKTFGKATASMDGTGELIDLDGGDTIDFEPGAQSLSISQEQNATGIDTQMFGGAEINIFGFVIAGKGAYNFNSRNVMLEGGVRFQF